jgi:hypothetical protein
MNCPICNFGEITETTMVCPRCNSDLEAILVTRKIGRKSMSLLIFGIIVSALAFVCLVFLIIGIINKGDLTKKSIITMTPEEVTAIKGDMENIRAVNSELQIINTDLLSKLSAMEKANTKREQIYLVQEGESLFIIARKVLGNGYKYIDIARDNNIPDPDKLIAGQKLIIYY